VPRPGHRAVLPPRGWARLDAPSPRG